MPIIVASGRIAKGASFDFLIASSGQPAEIANDAIAKILCGVE